MGWRPLPHYSRATCLWAYVWCKPLRIEIDFLPEDSWTFWQRSSAKKENSKSS